jgi:hypothetical protein
MMIYDDCVDNKLSLRLGQKKIKTLTDPTFDEINSNKASENRSQKLKLVLTQLLSAIRCKYQEATKVDFYFNSLRRQVSGDCNLKKKIFETE